MSYQSYFIGSLSSHFLEIPEQMDATLLVNSWGLIFKVYHSKNENESVDFTHKSTPWITILFQVANLQRGYNSNFIHIYIV